jgi:hypothetical protein
MIDETVNKPYVRVYEGPLSDDGTKQFYYVCFFEEALMYNHNIYSVEMTSAERLGETVARAFEKIIRAKGVE